MGGCPAWRLRSGERLFGAGSCVGGGLCGFEDAFPAVGGEGGGAAAVGGSGQNGLEILPGKAALGERWDVENVPPFEEPPQGIRMPAGQAAEQCLEGCERLGTVVRVGAEPVEGFGKAGCHEACAEDGMGEGPAGADRAGESVTGAESGTGEAEPGKESGVEQDLAVCGIGIRGAGGGAFECGDGGEDRGFKLGAEVGGAAAGGPGFEQLGDGIHSAGGGPKRGEVAGEIGIERQACGAVVGVAQGFFESARTGTAEDGVGAGLAAGAGGGGEREPGEHAAGGGQIAHAFQIAAGGFCFGQEGRERFSGIEHAAAAQREHGIDAEAAGGLAGVVHPEVGGFGGEREAEAGKRLFEAEQQVPRGAGAAGQTGADDHCDGAGRKL